MPVAQAVEERHATVQQLVLLLRIEWRSPAPRQRAGSAGVACGGVAVDTGLRGRLARAGAGFVFGSAICSMIAAARSRKIREMPLSGEYQPGTSSWSRKHVEEYEATNGTKAGDMRGMPVVVLTTVGAKTGKLRKTALMRVEHDGAYAAVASLGGSCAQPEVVLQPQGEPACRAAGSRRQARLPRP